MSTPYQRVPLMKNIDFEKFRIQMKVPIGYSNLGYCGCTAYSDLNPRNETVST